jgi:hypothetical protein
MKTAFPFFSLLFTFFTLTLVSQAQDEGEAYPSRIPRWISEKGYWVVESNVKTPYNSIIHFYNNENLLVYREKVDGVKINLNRTRTKMRLKKVLEQSIVAWEKNPVPMENEQWVAKALREP